MRFKVDKAQNTVFCMFEDKDDVPKIIRAFRECILEFTIKGKTIVVGAGGEAIHDWGALQLFAKTIGKALEIADSGKTEDRGGGRKGGVVLIETFLVSLAHAEYTRREMCIMEALGLPALYTIHYGANKCEAASFRNAYATIEAACEAFGGAEAVDDGKGVVL